MLRLILSAIVLVCACCSGCFQYTEGPQGNLESFGLPGVPVWKSSAPPAIPSPAQAGFTPEEAAKIGGPVLVEPPSGSSRTYRYRYYDANNNKCEADLKTLLAERQQNGETGPAPYCTSTPSAPAAP